MFSCTPLRDKSMLKSLSFSSMTCQWESEIRNYSSLHSSGRIDLRKEFTSGLDAMEY